MSALPVHVVATAFPVKAYQIVDDVRTDNLIRWSSKGDAIEIVDAPNFAAQVLPLYFSHSNLCSFVRQLHTYGFHKLSQPSDPLMVYGGQPFFARHHPEWLQHMKRRSSAKRGKNRPQKSAKEQQYADGDVPIDASRLLSQLSVREDDQDNDDQDNDDDDDRNEHDDDRDDNNDIDGDSERGNSVTLTRADYDVLVRRQQVVERHVDALRAENVQLRQRLSAFEMQLGHISALLERAVGEQQPTHGGLKKQRHMDGRDKQQREQASLTASDDAQFAELLDGGNNEESHQLGFFDAAAADDDDHRSDELDGANVTMPQVGMPMPETADFAPPSPSFLQITVDSLGHETTLPANSEWSWDNDNDNASDDNRSFQLEPNLEVEFQRLGLF
jgi:HSF-type DNA-binding